MIDLHKIKSKVLENKILISNENISIEYRPIVFFIDNDEIVYIGRTEKKVLEYLLSKSKEINCTHYFIELVNIDEIDNIIAELILTLKPIYHNKISKNTKYISNNNAKKLYHIDKSEFKKYWDESTGLKLGKTLFLEKKVFDDIFSISQPYAMNMPKVGTYINCIEDIENTPIDINLLGQSCSRKEMDNGETIQEIRTFRREIPITENYKNLQLRFKHAYQVTYILNHNTFEAYSTYKNIHKKFIVEKEDWITLPCQYEQEMISHHYFESLKS